MHTSSYALKAKPPMEFTTFLRTLFKYRYSLILIPIITVAVAYFLVMGLPDTYVSRSRLATGLVDETNASVNGNKMSEAETNQRFGNIIQMTTLKKVVNQVSYQLFLHDISTDSPYHKPGKLYEKLSPKDKAALLSEVNRRYSQKQDLNLNNKEDREFLKLLESMKYDQESLEKKLLVYRINNSDYIDMQYESESPALSAAVLNNLAKELINHYSITLVESNTKAVEFMDSLVKQKQAVLSSKMANLQNYNVNNGIVDVDEEANSILGQISELKAQKQEAQKAYTSSSISLKNLNDRYLEKSKTYGQVSVSQINQQIAALRKSINIANEEYIQNNNNPAYKGRLDSLRNLLNKKIEQVADRGIYRLETEKQDLEAKTLPHEAMAGAERGNVNGLNQRINALTRRFQTLVPNHSKLKVLQDEIDLAGKELLDASKKYEEIAMDASGTIKLRQIEAANPGEKVPSKKLLLILLSGITSFTLCLVVIFAIFFFDNSISDPELLANKTAAPVYGFLGYVPGAKQLSDLWKSGPTDDTIRSLKNQLRSISFEIDNTAGVKKTIVITSLQEMEGKTFLAMNLAEAYKLINKKILLIDGNFDNPSITNTVTPNLFIEDLLKQKETDIDQLEAADFMVAGNRGGDKSIFEVQSEAAIISRLELLRAKFDIIIIDTPALGGHKAKEWISLSDKFIAVFESGRSIPRQSKIEMEYLAQEHTKFLGWILNKYAVNSYSKESRAKFPKKSKLV